MCSGSALNSVLNFCMVGLINCSCISILSDQQIWGDLKYKTTEFITEKLYFCAPSYFIFCESLINWSNPESVNGCLSKER